jgi:hypothetical protein
MSDAVIVKFVSMQITGVRILLKQCSVIRDGNTVLIYCRSVHLSNALKLAPINYGSTLELSVQIICQDPRLGVSQPQVECLG